MARLRTRDEAHRSSTGDLIDYLIGAMQEVVVIEAEIENWDEVERLGVLHDYEPVKSSIERVRKLERDRMLTDEQHERYEELERVIDSNAATLNRLEVAYLT